MRHVGCRAASAHGQRANPQNRHICKISLHHAHSHMMRLSTCRCTSEHKSSCYLLMRSDSPALLLSRAGKLELP